MTPIVAKFTDFQLPYLRMNGTIEEQIAKRIADAAPVLEQIPGVVIIHHLKASTVLYMSASGLRRLQVTLPQLVEMGVDYHKRFFNPDDAADYVPGLLGMIDRNNDDETVTFFQQVRAGAHEPWQWHVCGIRIFMRDDLGLPLLTISVATPIDATHYFISKVERMLAESETMRRQPGLMDKLTKREQQILVMMAKDKTSLEISKLLFIAVDTVKTHRRNIKRKLGVNNHYELLSLVQAFNII